MKAHKMNSRTFMELRSVVQNKIGIIIPKEISNRKYDEINKIAIRHKLDWPQLISNIKDSSNDDLLKEFADILTISHTFFFRERTHFDFLASEILPQLANDHVTDLRIWSAATASGEEAVSILMTMREFYGEDYRFIRGGVLATDISTRSLSKGIKGIYRKDALSNIPVPNMLKWFRDDDDNNVILDEAFREDILYRWINLTAPMPPFKGKFHVIFCRNVMLYFDEITRNRLVEKLSGMLYDGGWLILGMAEDAGKAELWLNRVSPSISRKIGEK